MSRTDGGDAVCGGRKSLGSLHFAAEGKERGGSLVIKQIRGGRCLLLSYQPGCRCRVTPREEGACIVAERDTDPSPPRMRWRGYGDYIHTCSHPSIHPSVPAETSTQTHARIQDPRCKSISSLFFHPLFPPALPLTPRTPRPPPFSLPSFPPSLLFKSLPAHEISRSTPTGGSVRSTYLGKYLVHTLKPLGL